LTDVYLHLIKNSCLDVYPIKFCCSESGAKAVAVLNAGATVDGFPFACAKPAQI
jgi:hypothetical protein